MLTNNKDSADQQHGEVGMGREALLAAPGLKDR